MHGMIRRPEGVDERFLFQESSKINKIVCDMIHLVDMLSQPTESVKQNVKVNISSSDYLES